MRSLDYKEERNRREKRELGPSAEIVLEREREERGERKSNGGDGRFVPAKLKADK